MRLFLFLFSLFAFCSKTNKAQNIQHGKYSITTQPLQFLCREANINVERIYNRNSLGIILAYRFDSRLESNPNSFAKYWAGNENEYTSPRFKGLSIGINSKYFIKKKNLPYIEAQVFYRHWWFDNKFYALRYDGGSTPDQEYITTLRNNIIGAKLLFGNSLIYSKNKHVKFVFNYYFGAGGRVKYISEKGIERTVYDDFGSPSGYSDYNKKKTEFLPTIHAGFNLGLELFSKNIALK